MRLYHFSDQPGLTRFEPRPDRKGRLRVWAVADTHQQNYLLPRDCPRICLHANAGTSEADHQRFLQGADWRIVVETGWMERIHAATLIRYRFAPEGFAIEDENAGYHVSQQPEVPIDEELMTDLPSRIAALGTRLDHRPCLWQLREDVAASSLGFSIIRFAHAAPAPAGFISAISGAA